LTVTVIVAILLFLEPIKIAKLASAFQLMMFALLCLAVIVMRESGLASYDPSYRAPFYPGLHIFGIVAPFVLIAQMGLMPTLFSAGLILVGGLWYSHYGSKRVSRQGAIYHMFARLGKNRHDELDVELRTILKEKGLRDQDPFEEAVLDAHVIDAEDVGSFDNLIVRAAEDLAPRLGVSIDRLVEGFTEGAATGATPVSKGVALPHMHLPDIPHPTMVLVRTREEIRVVTGDVFGKPHATDKIHAVFFLVSPEGDPGQHLRMLAQLASRIDQDDFIEHWLAAKNEVQLREVFLRGDRYISIRVRVDHPSIDFVGRTLQEMDLPEQCLVAALRRGGETLVPRGTTSFELGDRLLVIGGSEAIGQLYARFGVESKPPREI
jgi:APA family basic amino acid/polyamine antiporter